MQEREAFLYLPPSASHNGTSETRIQTRAEQTAKFQGNERQKRGVRNKLLYTHKNFNYIVPRQESINISV